VRGVLVLFVSMFLDVCHMFGLINLVKHELDEYVCVKCFMVCDW